MRSYLKLLTICALAVACFVGIAHARGGASSGGGGHSSASHGGGRSASSAQASRPTHAPSAAPRSTTTTTTTTRSVNTQSRYVSGGANYGGMGMGYGYSNGLVTGMILGHMMHPHNTVVYAGGGSYSNNALLYPDGRVVNQNGQQVGTYQNGQFTEMQNGPIVAQPVPQDAMREKEMSVADWLKAFALCVLAFFLIIIFVGLLKR